MYIGVNCDLKKIRYLDWLLSFISIFNKRTSICFFSILCEVWVESKSFRYVVHVQMGVKWSLISIN